MTVICYHINVILDVNNVIEELIDKGQKVGKNVGRRKKVRLEQIAVQWRKENSYGRYNNSSGRGNGYNSILSDVINYCIRFLKERLPEIETAALGNEAGMIGAASLL